MKEMLEILKLIIPVIATLGGAALGSSLTRKNQEDLFSRQLDKEKLDEYNKNLHKTLEVYNRLLEIHGKEFIVERSITMGGEAKFNVSIYMNKFRPFLYDKFHLLHLDIARSARKIDYEMERMNFEEDMDERGEYLLVNEYDFIIENILDHIAEFRNQNELK